MTYLYYRCELGFYFYYVYQEHCNTFISNPSV